MLRSSCRSRTPTKKALQNQELAAAKNQIGEAKNGSTAKREKSNGRGVLASLRQEVVAEKQKVDNGGGKLSEDYPFEDRDGDAEESRQGIGGGVRQSLDQGPQLENSA